MIKIDCTHMCSRCDALCCRVYDIFDGETGIHVKKAGTSCLHLENNLCSIHKKWSHLPGFRNSCEIYDCLGAGPIVTLLSRKMQDDFSYNHALLSSLLETVRIKLEQSPEEDRDGLLRFVQIGIENLSIKKDITLPLRILRHKIEEYKSEKI